MGQGRMFAMRANRDAELKRLRAEGRTVRAGSIRNQNLHPMYVTDAAEVGHGDYETGFGNTDYMTFWPVLYEIRENRYPY